MSTLDRLQWQSNRLNRLVVDLLDVSRLEQGVLTLKRIDTDLVSLVSAFVEEFRLLAPKRCIVFTKAEQPIEVYIDPVRINQVISNLLDNAIKYTPEDLLLKSYSSFWQIGFAFL